MMIPVLTVTKLLEAVFRFIRDDYKNTAISNDDKFINRLTRNSETDTFFQHEIRSTLKELFNSKDKNPKYLELNLGYSGRYTNQNAIYVFSASDEKEQGYIGQGGAQNDGSVVNGNFHQNHETILKGTVCVMVKAENHFVIEVLAYLVFNLLIGMEDLFSRYGLSSVDYSMAETQIASGELEKVLTKEITISYDYCSITQSPFGQSLISAIEANSELCLSI